MAHWVAGRSVPSTKDAARIAALLGVDIADLQLRERLPTGRQRPVGRLNVAAIVHGLKRRGITRYALAAEIGVPRQSVYAWLSGKSLPTTKSLERLAAAIGLDPSELVDPTNTDKPSRRQRTGKKRGAGDSGRSRTKPNQQRKDGR